MENNLLQVLWVENDPLVVMSYPHEAEMFGDLQLVAFSSWEEAEKALEEDYERWQAVILDAKCQYKKGDADKATRFLSNVFLRLTSLSSRKNRMLFWYVLSGQGEEDINELIPDCNYWDNDWYVKVNRRFYSKNSKITYGNQERYERQVLFERIHAHVTHYDQKNQIENNLYPEVFKSLYNLGLEDEIGNYLMALLIPIHFNNTSNQDYNRRYIDLRKTLEFIFRDMIRRGYLPKKIITQGKTEKLNLSWCSLFLGAEAPTELNKCKESEKKFWQKVERQTENPILPRQLAYWIKDAVFQTGGAAHSSEAEVEVAMNFEKYLSQVSNSPYMLRSLTMGLCDFILWYEHFTRENPDSEMNALKFWRLKAEKF